MSIRFQKHHIEENLPESDSASSSEDEEDQTWDDWASDSGKQTCKSLFDDQSFASVAEALTYDKKQHGYDLEQAISQLCELLLHVTECFAEIMCSIGLSWTDPSDQLHTKKCTKLTCLFKRLLLNPV